MRKSGRSDSLAVDRIQICPRCLAASGAPTRRRSLLEKWLVFLGGEIRRCGICRLRFLRFPALLDSSVSMRDACPRCSSSQVCQAQRRGMLESALGSLTGTLWRCGSCNARFVKWGTHAVLLNTKFRRASQWVLLSAGVVMANVLLLWLMAPAIRNLHG
jgi:hypothetical protein